jgi:hypothetical protein
MVRVSSERNATDPATGIATGASVPGPEDAAGTSVSTGLQYENQKPDRLLRRAVRLLNNADLKGASETLKEAARVMALQSDDTGAPDLPGKTGQPDDRTNDRNWG